MQLVVDRESQTPIYLQLVNQIKNSIIGGSLLPGTVLPPERKLAESLGVNRSTIITVYRELKADGLADAHVGKGTVVKLSDDGMYGEDPRELAPSYRQLFSQTAERAADPMLRQLLEMANRKDLISFAAGISPFDTDPLDALKGIEAELVSDGQYALKHTPTEGLPELREAVRCLMEDRGVSSRLEETLILSGSQQGINLTARALIDPGDIVLVEEPSFFCALQIFHAVGARIVGVPMDEEGLRTDVLETLLKRCRPKLLYTMPTFQNPTGICMSANRKKRLLELAKKHEFLILEDDPYGDIAFDGERPGTLKEMDTCGYVIYLSTFSKVLFPGIRIGWMTAPEPVTRQIALLKQLEDLHANSLSQWLVLRFLKSGAYKGHVQWLCQEYGQKRDRMHQALKAIKNTSLHWIKPKGGYYIWLKLPEGIPHMTLLVRAGEKGVAYVPGTAFYTGDRGGSFIRLNFTYPKREEITEGIRRLDAAIHELKAKDRPAGGKYAHSLAPII